MVLNTLPNKKKFGGEVFVLEDAFWNRSPANQEKERLKESGVKKVRVVPIKIYDGRRVVTTYAVYKRSL